MRRLAMLFIAVLGVITIAVPSAIAQSDSSDEEPTLEGDSGDGKPKRTKDYRDTLEDAIADIQLYWTAQFPALYGADYEPIPRSRIIAAKPGIKLPKCQGQTVTYDDAQGNAFYCYRSNFIVYDDVGLFPQLHRDFGGLAVPLVLAHEWGHAIEDRARNVAEPTILKELQADCFAGAWLARVAAGEAPRIELEGGELDSALTALLSFRDPVGTSPDEEGAHGAGFDRVAAFQEGFEGAEGCVDYYDAPPTIVEIPFDDELDAASGGNLPRDAVFRETVFVLNVFFEDAVSQYEPRTIDDVRAFDSTTGSSDDLPVCGGTTQAVSEVRNRVFYCPDDDAFLFDRPYLEHIYDDIGDFGVITLLANSFATYVQTIQGFPGIETNPDVGLLAGDCSTGGFARTVFDGTLLDQRRRPVVTLSPGDLDETIQALADDSSARGIDASLDATFTRVFAFRDGFFNGYDACAAYLDVSL